MSADSSSKTENRYCPKCERKFMNETDGCPECGTVLEVLEVKEISPASRIPHVSVTSEDGGELTSELDPDRTIECTECGYGVKLDEIFCPECDNDMEDTIRNILLDEMMSLIDDDSFEIDEVDSSIVIEKIKLMAPLLGKEQDELDMELSFICPICGAEVSESAETCPGCGAIFED